jgi:tetrapyrrole methylase family protein/MazG family protein
VTARVVVVGLGPAGADHLLPAARSALERIPRRFTRTERHPAVADLAGEGVTFETFDDLYDRAGDLDGVYSAIVAALRSEAEQHGEVLYAVPGSPVVAERSVSLLLGSGVEVELVPGLSFADLAWSRLAIDPLRGARVLDGRSLSAFGVTGPTLVAQCDSRLVLSDVKLALLERFGPETPVVVLQRLGLRDEAVTTVALEDLDRTVEPDHLTSVYVDAEPGEEGEEFARFVALVERLRGPGGCPWDAEQTHHSLTRHLIEEAYEVVEVLEALPSEAPGGAPVEPGAYAKVEEELGDLTAQVVFHATLAREAGAFGAADVLRGIREKLVRRHPHVFGDVEVEGADHVMRNWEQLKREERGVASLMDSVPEHLPSLLYAHKLFRQAEAGHLRPMTADEAAAAIAAAVSRVGAATDGEAERLVGEVLAATALLARHRGFDAESALRGWARRFRDRFAAMELLAAERGVDLASAGFDEVAVLWIDAGTTTGEATP